MRVLSFFFSILLIAVLASSVSASTVNFIVDASADDGTFDVFADVSLGDNAGLAFYLVQFDGTNDDILDLGPRAINSATFAPQGFSLNLLTGTDQQRINRGQNSLSLPTLVYGFGQTAGSLLNPVGAPGDSLEQPDYGAPLLIGSGTYADIGALTVLNAVANTWDVSGETGATQANSTVEILLPSSGFAGDSQENPILPDNSELDPNGSWLFANFDTTGDRLDGGWWFDPPTDHAMLYEITDGVSTFGSVGMPTIGDANGGFNVSAVGLGIVPNSTVVEEGASIAFPAGTMEFLVWDIDPTIDGSDPVAFPTLLSFSTTDGGSVSFTMPPIPEPSTLALIGLGMVALVGYRRRK